MEILSDLQISIIKFFGQTTLKDKFFLTGGTALSYYYLKHRFSEDLDFFTEEPGSVRIVKDIVIAMAEKMDLNYEISRNFETFCECFVSTKSERIKLHFAQDTPFRLKPILLDPVLDFHYDNELDIACNKFSALFDRHDIKDFVDVYFLSKEFMNFEKLHVRANEKHVGMDDYWLAVSLDYINTLEKLPRMIKPVTIEELRQFYYEKIKFLMKRIKK
jgi:predicted nucleotidyltransferase component of viral defense system